MRRPPKDVARVGRYKPVMQLNKLVLPALLGPMTDMSSPGCTVRFTSVKAAMPPN